MKNYIHLWYLAEFFLGWEMFQTKVVEAVKTHFMFNNFFPENRAVYEIMWKKFCTAGQATDDNIIRRMRIVRWITKVTDTHWEYVILIAFSRQQWLRERASLLLLYAHSLSCLYGLFWWQYGGSCAHNTQDTIDSRIHGIVTTRLFSF